MKKEKAYAEAKNELFRVENELLRKQKEQKELLNQQMAEQVGVLEEKDKMMFDQARASREISNSIFEEINTDNDRKLDPATRKKLAFKIDKQLKDLRNSDSA